MEESIRILHLEDSVRDAELIGGHLAASGLACNITLAKDRPCFETALGAGPWHIILCDYNIPGYDGLSALQLAQRKTPQTPVIMLSGSLNSEEAVRCLHAGAIDYLFKERLERLASAISRALQLVDAHQRQLAAEQALRESEERFRQLAEQSRDGFWFVGLNPEQTIYVSPAVEEI